MLHVVFLCESEKLGHFSRVEILRGLTRVTMSCSIQLEDGASTLEGPFYDKTDSDGDIGVPKKIPVPACPQWRVILNLQLWRRPIHYSQVWTFESSLCHCAALASLGITCHLLREALQSAVAMVITEEVSVFLA